jgi:hypothetical protein
MYSMCSLHAVRFLQLRHNAHAAGARINFEYFLSAMCEAEISFRDTHTNSLLTPFITLSLLQALDQIDGQTSPNAVVPTAMS